MGTEVKLKREAIERRIAELEGKMPDIQASKEGAEARATIRRLKARLKTYPQEPKSGFTKSRPDSFSTAFSRFAPTLAKRPCRWQNRMRDEHRRNPHLLRD